MNIKNKKEEKKLPKIVGYRGIEQSEIPLEYSTQVEWVRNLRFRSRVFGPAFF